MNELNCSENNDEWAYKKGIKRPCDKHPHIEYDPMIGCSECLKEKHKREEKEREEKRQKIKNAFDKIVWPADDKSKRRKH